MAKINDPVAANKIDPVSTKKYQELRGKALNLEKFYMLYDDHDNPVHCASCNSTDVELIPEDEKVYGAGLYSLYDFTGGIDKFSSTYRCLQCGYIW